MPLTPAQIANGMPLERDNVFAECPADPEMRESVSVWLFEDNGAFCFPRGGVEAEAASWQERRHQSNFAFPDGRVLNGAGKGPAHSPFDAEGRPSVLGAGPIAFTCIEPFRHWRLLFDGPASASHVSQQIEGVAATDAQTLAVRLEADMIMETPAWIQDNTPEALAKMTEEEKRDAAFMGLGWRFEQLFRATGRLTIDGQTTNFKGHGLRIKRQSVRPLAGFRGHAWQSALFPDGRAFGYIAYPPDDAGRTFAEGYVYVDGKMYPARPVTIPWLRRITPHGDECLLELDSELGTTRIKGVTAMSTFRVGNPDMGGLNLQQAGVLYEWDGQKSYGMIERSSHHSLTRLG